MLKQRRIYHAEVRYVYLFLFIHDKAPGPAVLWHVGSGAGITVNEPASSPVKFRYLIV